MRSQFHEPLISLVACVPVTTDIDTQYLCSMSFLNVSDVWKFPRRIVRDKTLLTKCSTLININNNAFFVKSSRFEQILQAR